MDFRIRKTDPYLDFFKNQGIQEDLGDPYDPIPEEILRDREFELEEKETPSTWDTIAKWSGLSGLNKEIAQPLLEVPGIKQLTQGIGRTIPAIGETAKHIGDLIAPSDTDLGHSQANESTIPAGPFIGMKGSEILAGARGGLAGAVETIPEVFSLADVTPFGRAAKYAGALGDILSADKAIRGGKALQTGAESLQDLERLSSGINVGISAGQVGQGLEDLDENKAQGLFEIGTGLAGAGLGSKGLTENFISPESKAKATENLEKVFPPSLSQIGPTYKGQEVKILGRRGSTVKIELPDGTSKTVGFSELGKPNVGTKTEAPKSKYSDLVKELDEIDKSLGEENAPQQESMQETPQMGATRLIHEAQDIMSKFPKKEIIDPVDIESDKIQKELNTANFKQEMDKFEPVTLEERNISDLNRETHRAWLDKGSELDRRLSQTVDKLMELDEGTPEYSKLYQEAEHLQDQVNHAQAQADKYGNNPVLGGRLRKESQQPKNLEEIIIDPSDVSIVAPDANILPEYGYPTKPGRPGKQGPELPKQLGGKGGGGKKPPPEDFDFMDEEGSKPEDWLKTAAREVPKIERGQAADIIKDQPFRDQIKLQDQILKEQEMEALKAGKAEEAHKAALERKILRAQNDEVFQQFKKEEADKVRSEKEQNSYQRRLLKEQEAEDLASRELKQKVAGHGESIKPEGWKQQALDIFRVPIAYRASGDIPALSHARFDTLAHPIESFKRLKNEALPAVFSEKKQQEVFDRITNNDKFDSAIKGGLEFTKQGYDPGAQSFGSYTAENLPVGGQVVKASQRGQNVYLDDTRMTRFEQLMNDAGVDSFESDPKATKQIADFVNTVTGYGKIDNVKAESVLRAANSIFWSIRKRVARVQHLKLLGDAINPASDMLPTLRKEIARQAIPTIGIGVGLLALMEQAGAKVDWDWRNSNFMKARFPTKSGKWLAWTPFGDYMTTVKLLAQQASGKKITDKGEYDLDNPKGIFDPTRTSILSDYAYNALNPSSRAVLDALNPKTELAGSPFLDVDEYPNASKALELMTPINVSNQGEMYKELGPVSSLFAPLTGIGEGIDINDPEHFAKMRARAQGKPYSPKKKKGKRKGRVLSLY